jgi:hypothetical protein
MSAPPATVAAEPVSPPAPPAPVSSGPVQTSVNGAPTQNVTPVGAGIAGGVLGFGAGLVVAELVVPGLVLGAVALVGLAAAGRLSRFIGRKRS